MIRRFLSGVTVWFTLTLLLNPCFAAAADQREQASDYFEEGEYAKALSLWYQMAESGSCTAGLYFNIGLGESKLNNIAKAMLAFEQASRLNPANRGIHLAIEMEREKILNATIPVSSFFLADWYKALVTFLRPGYWALFGLILLAVGCYWFKVRSAVLIPGGMRSYPLAIYLIFIGLLFAGLGFLSYKELYRTDEAIIMESCEIRQAPTPDSPLNMSIQAGEKVIIKDEIGEWSQVQLLNLDEGWIQKKCLGLISID